MNARNTARVLVPADLSPSSVNAAWRAALVARELGASVQLLHAQADEGLARLARDIRCQVGVHVDVQAVDGDPLAGCVRAARDALMVVIGSRRVNPLRELVLGTQAERLIRLCRVPVLVVKRPATAGYRRVLVPVDLGPQALAAMRAAARLARGPAMEVLHALDVRDEIGMRACDVPEWVMRRHRRLAADHATASLRELIDQTGAQAQDFAPAVSFGDAAAVVLARAQAMRAELLVIGKRTRGLLADFLLGSVTQRLLARAKADVLVLPQPRNADASAAPPWRLLRTAG